MCRGTLKKRIVDWIQGDKFIDIADYRYAPAKRAKDDYNNLSNTLEESDGIIYTHTMYVEGLFEALSRANTEVVVITHNSDASACITPPDNVKRWYSQNVDIIHPRVESLPIGIENNRWYPKKRGEMIKCLSEKRELGNLAYMNHSIRTNLMKRELLYRMFEDKSWVDAAQGRNGYRFSEYIRDIYNHRFIFCPEGNGIDTHRTWECLYMGSIPIMKRNINNTFYTDLPICYVDSWEEVTEDFLQEEHVRIKSKTWNMEKLNFEYWKDKIRSHGNF